METFTTSSVDATIELGRELAGRFGRGDLVALSGELGAGKTVLVRGLAAGWGVPDERIVSSPTFVLIHEYEGATPIYHIDLYRMGAPQTELAGLGLGEMLADGIVAIEWADRVREALPRPYWQITIEHVGPRRRRFRLERME